MLQKKAPAIEHAGFAESLGKLLRVFFWDALKISIGSPARALFFLRTAQRQRRAARTRSRLRQQGFHIPPIVLFSVTNKCNLHCKGCYSWALQSEFLRSIRQNRDQLREAEGGCALWVKREWIRSVLDSGQD